MRGHQTDNVLLLGKPWAREQGERPSVGLREQLPSHEGPRSGGDTLCAVCVEQGCSAPAYSTSLLQFACTGKAILGCCLSRVPGDLAAWASLGLALSHT